MRKRIPASWGVTEGVVFCLIALCLPGAAPAHHSSTPEVGTFSIVAYDSVTGELGVAVQSKALAVGSRVPYALAGVGAIATQARTNVSYGPEGLSLLEIGVPVEQVIDVLTSKDQGKGHRQLGIVDAHGQAAAYTGDECSEWAGHVVGHHYAVQGNTLAGEQVVLDMASTFEGTSGTLGERLLAALTAGQMAGGDRRGQQAAALLVVKPGAGVFIDLRVDDHERPIKELERLFELHERDRQAGTRASCAQRLIEEGQTQRAEREFEIALAISDKYPDDPNLQNDLAWVLATAGMMLDDALRLAKRAVELAPDDGNVWDTLGEAHFRRGEYQDAVRAQTRAVVLSPGNEPFKQRLEQWEALAGG